MSSDKLAKSETKIITYEQIQEALLQWNTNHDPELSPVVDILREIGEGLRTGDLAIISVSARKRAVIALEAAAELKAFNKAGAKSRRNEALKLLQLSDG